MSDKTLPDGWQWKRLEEVCEKITDGTHQTPTYFDEGVVFLSSKNVTSGQIDWENVKYIDEKQHLEMHKRVAPRINDILLAKNGTTGVAAIVDRDIIFDIYVSLAFLRPLAKIQPHYLLYINSPLAKEQFNSRLKGAGVPNLHLEEIRKVEIPLPPLEEQKRIVAKIDAAFEQLDAAISLQKNNISRTETLKKALLVEQFSKLPYEKKKLGEISKIISGFAFKSSDFLETNPLKCIKITNVGVNSFNLNDENNLPSGYDNTYKEFLAFENDIVIALTRPYISDGLKVAIVPNEYNKSLVNQRVACIRQTKANLTFIYLFLSSDFVLEYVKEKSKALNQPNSSIKDLQTLEIPLPPISEQEKIVAYLDKSFAEIDAMLEAQKIRLEHLEGMKKAILQEAFEGKL